MIPASTTAIARPRRSAGTIRAAYPASIAHSVPPITPATSRAANVTPYDADSATTALLSANPSSAPIRTGRRGRPRSSAVTGIAAANEATAYPVTRKPTRDSGTPSAGAMRGSSPAGSSSVTTAVKAAVDRASSPAQGRGAGTTVPLARDAVDMRPSSDVDISVKASATGRQT